MIFILVIPILAIFVGLRFKGLTQKHAPLEHPWIYDSEPQVIAYQAGSAEWPANTWYGIDQIRKLSWKYTIWIDIQQTADNHLVLYAHQYLQKQTSAEGHIGFQKWGDIKDLDAGYTFGEKEGFPFRGRGLRIRPLKETLERYPEQKFVLNIVAHRPSTHELLLKLLKETKIPRSHILINSGSANTLEALREKQPLWVYGMDKAEMTRILMLKSMFLETFVEITGDFFLSTEKFISRQVSQDLITEIHRRHKKIFPGLVSDKTEWDEKWKPLGVDGVVTARPSQFLFFFHSLVAEPIDEKSHRLNSHEKPQNP